MKTVDRRTGVRFRMLACLFAFTALAVLILWLTQNVFLEDVYKSIKTSELKRAGTKIASAVAQEDFADEVEKIAEEYGICVIVLSENGSFAPISVDLTRDCVIHHSNSSVLTLLYNRAQKEEDGILYFSEDGYQSDGREAQAQGIVLAKAVPYHNDTARILLNSGIAPVSATVHTLNRILIYVTIALIALSVLLAFLMSGIIARPIMAITKQAERLADGQYDAQFRRGGYAEIDSLALTLDRAQTELSKVDRLQKELIANISHDLRTPLTMISGYSQIMRDIPGENTPENLQIIIDETERLTSLVNDVLDISRLHSGALRFEKKRLCLTDLISRAMKRYAKFAAGGYDIVFEKSEELYIDGDENRVLQVIYNLVNNAVTYTGEDKRVLVSLTRQGQAARLSVTDTGDGIPAEQLQDIWERYYKADEVHKRSAIGTGLGLSIVREIMKEHGGHYGVTSTIGVGSTFWVDFPLAQ